MMATRPRLNESHVTAWLARQGLRSTRWSNGSHVVYDVHAHSYGKVLCVVEGSITFTLESSGRRISMKPGDRLKIPAQTPHRAVVGPEGVVCLEAHHHPT